MTNAHENSIVADEGSRLVRVPGAEATYRIRALNNGRYSISYRGSYLCRDHRVRVVPAAKFPDRQSAIDHFLAQANAFFKDELSGSCCSASQRQAQALMLHQLEGCPLFGFLEPPDSSQCQFRLPNPAARGIGRWTYRHRGEPTIEQGEF
ncbi:MAG: hypothetical protein AAF802_03995 [Planctomycetota bacterium]